MSYVLPEIFLPILLAFLLGLGMGRLIWHRRPNTSNTMQQTATALEPAIDLTDAHRLAQQTPTNPQPASASRTSSSPQFSSTSQVVGTDALTGGGEAGTALVEIDDELAAARDEVMSLKDDLSASEAKLVLAQEDLRATRELVPRAGEDSALRRNEITPVTSENSTHDEEE